MGRGGGKPCVSQRAATGVMTYVPTYVGTLHTQCHTYTRIPLTFHLAETDGSNTLTRCEYSLVR